MLVVPRFKDVVQLQNEGLLRVWSEGRVKVVQERELKNIIVNVGLNWLRSNALVGSTIYTGLLATGATPVVGDTMAAHPGWTELTAYSQANRLSWGQSAGGSTGLVTNVGNEPAFTMTSGASVAGIFTVTDSTKGGTSGTLITVPVASGGDATPGNGQILEPTYSITIS